MKRQVIGMKERINRLAKGIIDSEQPKMTWSPEKIDETLRMNTLMQRNLWIGSENGLSVKGFVYSSNLRCGFQGITIRLADSGAGSYMKWTLRS